jgi:phosphoadenosine phosphosulfate reductase
VEKLRAVEALLREAAETRAPAVLASSLGVEDMLLLDVIDAARLDIGVFTLDTGRLHQETYDLLQAIRRRYRTPVAVYTPDAADLEPYIAAHGPNAFYDSLQLRVECCRLRKKRPLERALAGRGAWITGQRRDQAVTRAALSLREWDAENGLYKYNPLADWSEAEVWAYIRAHDVPHNTLHTRGYRSIGCAPCTRAVLPGEDGRAGRWWWENPETKECGLHPRQQQHG